MKPKKSKPKRKYKYRPRFRSLAWAHTILIPWSEIEVWRHKEYKALNYILHRLGYILNHD